MLHRRTTEAFLVQSFFNLILKVNTIAAYVSVSCLMPWQVVSSKLMDSIIASLLYNLETFEDNHKKFGT